jgi:hypothetical protein
VIKAASAGAAETEKEGEGMIKSSKRVLIGVITLAAVSSLLFLKQGGFGGGHGAFDMPLFIMGLPWAAIPWPKAFYKHDLVWLIALPFCLNVGSVLGLTAIFRRRRHARLGN